MKKLSKEEQTILHNMILDDSTKINSFLADAFEEQAKSQNKQFIINLIFVILTLIIAIATLIVTILK